MLLFFDVRGPKFTKLNVGAIIVYNATFRQTMFCCILDIFVQNCLKLHKNLDGFVLPISQGSSNL